MNLHICTRESFIDQDSPQIQAPCPICGNDGEHTLGWLDLVCRACGSVYDPDNLAEVALRRRMFLGLSKQETARRYGVTAKTITQYEKPQKVPPLKYMRWWLLPEGA